MDNNKSLTQSILQTSGPSVPSASLDTASLYSSSNSGSSSESFFDFFKNISLTTWLIIILILAFLGFNIFVYLAKGTQDITNFFGPFLQKIFGTTFAVAGQTVDVAAEGSKAVVGGTAGAINTGLSAVQDVTPNKAPSSVGGVPVVTQKPGQIDNNTLNRALNKSQVQQPPSSNDPQSDLADSSIQGGGKSGWCYIGIDRGFRSCSQVNDNDICMSGDIFPTQEICVNPRLRP
jgi:hypothetical protein